MSNLTLQPKLRRKLSYLLGGLFLCLGSTLSLQGNFENVDTTRLFERMQARINVNDYDRALPKLEELKERRIRGEARENVFFFLTLARLLDGNLEGALEASDLYLEDFPEHERERFLSVYRADALRGLGRYEEALEILREYPNRRNWGNWSRDFRIDVRSKIAETFYLIEDWENALSAIETLIQQLPRIQDEAQRQEMRLRAYSYLIQTYIGLGRLDEAFSAIPNLAGDTDARFDLSFNMALIRGGDQMREAENYNAALAFYQSVILPDQIREHFNNRLEMLRQEPPRSETLARIQSIERRLEIIEDLPPDVVPSFRWRIGDSYYNLGRLHEAYWAFRRVWDEHPDHPFAERAMYGSFNSAHQLGRKDRAQRIGEAYMADEDTTLFYGIIGSRLWDIYRAANDAQAITTLADQLEFYVLEEPESDQAGIGVTTLGSALSSLRDFDRIQTVMNRVYRAVGTGDAADNAQFWIGTSAMMQRDFQTPINQFKELVERSPDAPFAEEASFRIPTSYMALREWDEAKNYFNQFLENYPESRLVPDALGMMGDIGYAQRDRETAFEFYDRAITAATPPEMETPNMQIIDRAFFRRAGMARNERDYPTVVQLLEEYREDFIATGLAGAESASRGLFELGQSYAQRGQDEQMVEIFLEAVSNYGDLRRSYGVDSMINTLVNRYEEIRGSSPRAWFINLRAEARAANEQTKELRTVMALNRLGRDTSSPLLDSDQFFTAASPATLAWYGQSIIQEDQERARRAFQTLLSEFPDSDEAISALLGEGDFLLSEGQYTEAKDLFQQATQQFSRNDRVVEAHLGLGNALLRLGEYEDAEQAFRRVTGNRSWRHRWAPAHFGIARSQEGAGNPDDAINSYHRVFITYLRSTEYSAEAYLRAGKLHEEANRPEKARALYEQMLERDVLSDTPQFSEARERLQSL
ncbi:MAG: tetratricopeptide repeat protein [Opitutales bacterium]|nr:tetratricopeptide repeat protein [Opitutales bacterium]